MAALFIFVSLAVLGTSFGDVNILTPACVNGNQTMRQLICTDACACACPAYLAVPCQTVCYTAVDNIKGTCDLSHSLTVPNSPTYAGCGTVNDFCQMSCGPCCESPQPNCVDNCKNGAVAFLVGTTCRTVDGLLGLIDMLAKGK